jgi:Family of unknown function (DUF6184)
MTLRYKAMRGLMVAGTLACMPGCPRTASTPAAAAPPLDDAAAASQVAAVRCDHEQACDNVGQGRLYATREACFAEMTKSAEGDLGPVVCPLGVDVRRLNACIGQFQRESCHPLAPLSRMVACAPNAVCAHHAQQYSPADVYGGGDPYSY